MGTAQHGLKIEIRYRHLEREKRLKDAEYVYDGEYLLRKTKETIDGRCGKHLKQDCAYPCAWDIQRDKCDKAGKYPYRPK